MTADAVSPDEIRLDLRGLKCPLPVLRLRRALTALPAGATVAVEATDPMAAIDVPHFCRSEGHTLLASSQQDSVLQFRIQKATRPGD